MYSYGRGNPPFCVMMNYQLIKTKRKTIAVSVRDGIVIVRAPLRTTRREADAFVKKYEDWISSQLEKDAARRRETDAVPKLTQQEIADLYARAKEAIPDRVRYYAERLGADYGRVTIRCQRSRWGSCSAKRNLNFNCLLMLAPDEVIDAIVVHEVCHLKEMNHSARFYALVLSLYPDYHRWNQWLKDNGRLILARVPRE